MKTSNKYFLPIVIIMIGIVLGAVGAFLKIQKTEYASVILLISLIVEFSGLFLLILKRLKK